MVLVFAFFAALLVVDLMLFLRAGAGGLEGGGALASGESGSCGLLGPAGTVGVGAASMFT